MGTTSTTSNPIRSKSKTLSGLFVSNLMEDHPWLASMSAATSKLRVTLMAQCLIGLKRIMPSSCKLYAEFLNQSNASSLLPKVNHRPSLLCNLFHRGIELRPTITTHGQHRLSNIQNVHGRRHPRQFGHRAQHQMWLLAVATLKGMHHKSSKLSGQAVLRTPCHKDTSTSVSLSRQTKGDPGSLSISQTKV